MAKKLYLEFDKLDALRRNSKASFCINRAG